ncbi:MAG: S41 family peptidase [Planctomycetota bacterium]|jgi:carboxyl-terminal processing protease
MMKRLMILALLLAAALPLGAQDADPDLFTEVWETVREHFYDDEYHGVDWDAMKQKYRPEAEKCATKEDLHAVINRMIAELKASHCVLVEGDVYLDHFAPEYRGRKTLRCGFEISKIEDLYFVTRLYEGSAAGAAGLCVGDEIVKIGGAPAGEAKALVDAGTDPGIAGDPHYFVRVKEGEPLKLVVRRWKGGPEEPVAFEPNEISLVGATRTSARVIERGKKKLGYVHLWHYLSTGIPKALRDAIRDDFAECDGLILDVRGRGGSPWVIRRILSYFTEGRARKWEKPVVCLIDEGSRSAKEIFAVMNVDSMSDGERLEGKGVEPDVKVERDIRYCRGKDEILKEGIRVLMRRLRKWY